MSPRKRRWPRKPCARIAALYAIEADIRGQTAEDRRAVRQQRSRPLVEAMHDWLTEITRPHLRPFRAGPGHPLRAQSLGGTDPVPGRWPPGTGYQHCRARHAAGCAVTKERLVRRRGQRGRHWAIVATLIQTAKLNRVEPLAWLTDVLERIVSGQTKRNELDTLLPWNWKADREVEAASR